MFRTLFLVITSICLFRLAFALDEEHPIFMPPDVHPLMIQHAIDNEQKPYKFRPADNWPESPVAPTLLWWIIVEISNGGVRPADLTAQTGGNIMLNVQFWSTDNDRSRVRLDNDLEEIDDVYFLEIGRFSFYRRAYFDGVNAKQLLCIALPWTTNALFLPLNNHQRNLVRWSIEIKK